MIDEESHFPRGTNKSLATKLHNGPGTRAKTVYSAPKDLGMTFSRATLCWHGKPLFTPVWVKLTIVWVVFQMGLGTQARPWTLPLKNWAYDILCATLCLHGKTILVVHLSKGKVNQWLGKLHIWTIPSTLAKAIFFTPFGIVFFLIYYMYTVFIRHKYVSQNGSN